MQGDDPHAWKSEEIRNNHAIPQVSNTSSNNSSGNSKQEIKIDADINLNASNKIIKTEIVTTPQQQERSIEIDRGKAPSPLHVSGSNTTAEREGSGAKSEPEILDHATTTTIKQFGGSLSTTNNDSNNLIDAIEAHLLSTSHMLFGMQKEHYRKLAASSCILSKAQVQHHLQKPNEKNDKYKTKGNDNGDDNIVDMLIQDSILFGSFDIVPFDSNDNHAIICNSDTLIQHERFTFIQFQKGQEMPMPSINNNSNHDAVVSQSGSDAQVQNVNGLETTHKDTSVDMKNIVNSSDNDDEAKRMKANGLISSEKYDMSVRNNKVKRIATSERFIALPVEKIIQCVTEDDKLATFMETKVKRRVLLKTAKELKKVGIFSILTEDECSCLSELLEYVPLRKGENMLELGEPNQREKRSSYKNIIPSIPVVINEISRDHSAFSSSGSLNHVSSTQIPMDIEDKKNSMYIICDGVVQVSSRKFGLIQTLNCGKSFGDVSLLSYTRAKQLNQLGVDSKGDNDLESAKDTFTFTVIEEGVALRLRPSAFSIFEQVILSEDTRARLNHIREMQSPQRLKNYFPIFQRFPEKDIAFLCSLCTTTVQQKGNLISPSYDEIECSFLSDATKKQIKDSSSEAKVGTNRNNNNSNKEARENILFIIDGVVATQEKSEYVEEWNQGEFIFPFGVLRDLKEFQDMLLRKENDYEKERKEKFYSAVSSNSNAGNSTNGCNNNSNAIAYVQSSSSSESYDQNGNGLHENSNNYNEEITDNLADIINQLDAAASKTSSSTSPTGKYTKRSKTSSKDDDTSSLIKGEYGEDDNVSDPLDELDSRRSSVIERDDDLIDNHETGRDSRTSSAAPIPEKLGTPDDPESALLNAIKQNHPYLTNIPEESMQLKKGVSAPLMSSKINSFNSQQIGDRSTKNESDSFKPLNVIESSIVVSATPTLMTLQPILPDVPIKTNSITMDMKEVDTLMLPKPPSIKEITIKGTRGASRSIDESVQHSNEKGKMSKKRTSSFLDLLSYKNKSTSDKQSVSSGDSQRSSKVPNQSPTRSFSFTQQQNAYPPIPAATRATSVSMASSGSTNPPSTPGVYSTPKKAARKGSLGRIISATLGTPANNKKARENTDVLDKESDAGTTDALLGMLTAKRSKNELKGSLRQHNELQIMSDAILLTFPRALISNILLRNPEFESDFKIRCYRRECDLQSILNHPIGIEFFSKDLKSCYALENLEFYIEADEFLQELCFISSLGYIKDSENDVIKERIEKINSKADLQGKVSFRSTIPKSTNDSILDEINALQSAEVQSIVLDLKPSQSMDHYQMQIPTKKSQGILINSTGAIDTSPSSQINIIPVIDSGRQPSSMNKIKSGSFSSTKNSIRSQLSSCWSNGRECGVSICTSNVSENGQHVFDENGSEPAHKGGVFDASGTSESSTKVQRSRNDSHMENDLLIQKSLQTIGSKDSLFQSFDGDSKSRNNSNGNNQQSGNNQLDGQSEAGSGNTSSIKNDSPVTGLSMMQKSESITSMISKSSSQSSMTINGNVRKISESEAKEKIQKIYATYAAHVRSLYDKYIAHDAPKQINIESKTIEEFNDIISIEDNKKLVLLAIYILHDAQKQILSILKKDAFTRFRRSELFTDMLREIMSFPKKLSTRDSVTSMEQPSRVNSVNTASDPPPAPVSPSIHNFIDFSKVRYRLRNGGKKLPRFETDPTTSSDSRTSTPSKAAKYA